MGRNVNKFRKGGGGGVHPRGRKKKIKSLGSHHLRLGVAVQGSPPAGRLCFCPRCSFSTGHLSNWGRGALGGEAPGGEAGRDGERGDSGRRAAKDTGVLGGPLSLELASPRQAMLVFKSNARELMIFKVL